MSADKGTDWYGPETATFGDRLAGAREALGMSQRDLGDRLGVKTKTIQQWEDDLKEPRANRIQMLAGMLNVSLMWLLTGEGDGVAPPEEADAAPDDAALLRELGSVRGEMAALGERIGRLEVRLRRVLAREAT